ncbi:HutD family protein [Variovorax sp. J22P168]|uniref:HutD/Ves family protein n=1 Tax=Variovorax jilinensis TaxID=3053513 RepID=UPI002578DD57|nr:HutD family protein [Variovorax sp. J22P168]MDM0014360.1 HutD family protein [Variovorax sp. J22P168]
MSLRRFDLGALAAMPWKNGGGSTREIACVPAGAGMDSFDWRASVATIDRPGPFSAFEGVDRTIMLLEGAGVRLRSPDAGIDHRLDTPHQPFAFSGDLPLDCELLGGTSIDFNLMARRGRLRSALRVARSAEEVTPARHGLLMALRGRWRLQPLQLPGDDAAAADAIECAPGQGVWWDDAMHGWIATPLDDDDRGTAALAVARLDPTQRQTRET